MSPIDYYLVRRFNGVSLESQMWDAMEARFAETRS